MKFLGVLTLGIAFQMGSAASISGARDNPTDEAKTSAVDTDFGVGYSILVDAETSHHKGRSSNRKTNGQALLKPAFIRALKASAGVVDPFPTDRDDDETGNVVVQTTFLTTTSHRHVDRLPPNEDGRRPAVPAGEQVGFVALNTNEDAHLDVDGTCFPIEEGKLIQFDGSAPHHTVVKGGHVSLLGPFHLKTMSNVGGQGGCPNTNINSNITWTMTTEDQTETDDCILTGQYVVADIVLPGIYTADTLGAGFDTQITVYNDETGDFIGYDDCGPNNCGDGSLLTFEVLVPTRVRILVDESFDCDDTGICSPLKLQRTPTLTLDCPDSHTFYALADAERNACGPQDVYEIDALTGEATLKFNLSDAGIGLRGLALDPISGDLYSSFSPSGSDNTRGIARIDKTTGAVTKIGDGTPWSYSSLAFDCEGILYGVRNPSCCDAGCNSGGCESSSQCTGSNTTDSSLDVRRVFQIDTANGEGTLVANVPENRGGAAIAIDSTNQLYLSDNDFNIIEVDTSSGSLFLPGNLVGPDYISGAFGFDTCDNGFFAGNPDYGDTWSFFDLNPIEALPVNLDNGISVRGLTFSESVSCPTIDPTIEPSPEPTPEPTPELVDPAEPTACPTPEPCPLCPTPEPTLKPSKPSDTPTAAKSPKGLKASSSPKGSAHAVSKPTTSTGTKSAKS